MTNYDRDREIREARDAGIRALNSLRRTQKALDSARGWGVLDILGGGGLTSFAKHIKLDNAREALDTARCDLERFREELRDVDIPALDVGGFLTFADFFFDGFLADMLVQSRINEARARVERACGQVEDILRRLRDAG